VNVWAIGRGLEEEKRGYWGELRWPASGTVYSCTC
jgi:hypothetical protein